MSWKKEFSVGQPVVLEGIVFKVVNVCKRGIALRKVGTFTRNDESTAAEAFKRKWLKGEK